MYMEEWFYLQNLLLSAPNLLLLHTYHSSFIPEGVAEASQIFLRNAQVLPKLVSCEEYCTRERG
jgi:hypothetical protein